MRRKYVILKDYESPILFPEIISHDEITSRDSVLSAGFFSVSADSNSICGIRVDCYGESISLRVKSRPIEDSAKVKALITGAEMYEYSELLKEAEQKQKEQS